MIYEVRSQIDDTATVIPWKGLIQPGDYTLDKLLSQISTFDFAIFVFAADDMVESRGQRLLAARDNVVLELGLFMDRLGRKRTFLMVQEVTPRLHLPSDLEGLTIAPFKLPPEFSEPSSKKLSKVPPNVLEQALASACDKIRDAILDGSELPTPPGSLSGGMVYLLRYVETGGRSAPELAPALVHFQTKRRYSDRPDDEKLVWQKATQYACQCLQALGAVTSYDGNRYRISEEGRRLLSSQQLKHLFAAELKRKKIRLTPTTRVSLGTAPRP